jgi:patatin-related protein
MSPKSREVRLGIVMYGGVSLAIYINGVSQELFRAVRGSGMYKLIKALTDSDIVVDIISGTSAGGINGLMLAFALANGKEFGATKTLWREHGDLTRLLQPPNLGPDEYKSLLNSDRYYRAKLADAFRTMQDCPPDNNDLSPVSEMDVFITGTSIEGEIYTILDDAGHAVDVKDFRSIFKLKHRAGRPNGEAFKPQPGREEELYQALAKLARITSCFPGAFLPVRVLTAEDWHTSRLPPTSPERNWNEAAVDAKLCEWGVIHKSSYFLDGGVLDNKPFSPTIQAIFARTTERDIDRILFYVEPDPEQTEQHALLDPTFLKALLEGMLTISTYQSITEDIKVVEEHNSAVMQYDAVCRELRDNLQTHDTGVVPPAGLEPTQKSLYVNSRTTQLSYRAIRGILKDSATGKDAYLTNAADREKASNLVRSLTAPRGGDELPSNETLRRFDVYFRLRRLHHVASRIRELFCLAPGSTQYPDNSRLLEAINGHIELLEIVQYWFEYVLDHSPVHWSGDISYDEIWNQIRWIMEELFMLPAGPNDPLLRVDPTLPPHERLSTPVLQEIHANLRKRTGSVLANFDTLLRQPPGLTFVGPFYGILDLTDAMEAKIFGSYPASDPRFKIEYDQFVNLDAIVFPLEFLSDLREKDPIRLVRISPLSSGYGFCPDKGPQDKLAGRRLSHFSGFLKKSWRSNDILWGRLDGTRQLAETLLSQQVLERVLRDPDLLATVRDRLFQADGTLQPDFELKRLFPHSPNDSIAALEIWIRNLLAPPVGPGLESIYKPGLNLLIEMAQLEILHEEVPQVLMDAAAQQAEWNRFRVPVRNASATAAPAANNTRYAEYAPAPGFVDPALATVAALQTISNLQTVWGNPANGAIRPRDTAIGRFFEHDYAVATETVETGLPSLTAAGLLIQTLMVVNNCILGSLGPSMRKKITKNPVYIFGVNLPLHTTHELIDLWNRAPIAVAIFNTVVATACIVALIVAFKFNSEILLPARQHIWSWLILVVAPIIVLLLQAKMSKIILRIFLWGFGIFIVLMLGVWLFSSLASHFAQALSVVTPYAMVALAMLIAAAVGFWLGARRLKTQ